MKYTLVMIGWIDPVTDENIADDDTATAWLDNGSSFEAEIEFDGDIQEELLEFAKKKRIKPLFYLIAD